MIKKISIFIILFCIASIGYTTEGEGSDDFLKKSVQEVSALVCEHKEIFEEDANFLRSKMTSIVMPKLDIALIATIILGNGLWSGMTSQQNTCFVHVVTYRRTSHET